MPDTAIEVQPIHFLVISFRDSFRFGFCSQGSSSIGTVSRSHAARSSSVVSSQASQYQEVSSGFIGALQSGQNIYNHPAAQQITNTNSRSETRLSPTSLTMTAILSLTQFIPKPYRSHKYQFVVHGGSSCTRFAISSLTRTVGMSSQWATISSPSQLGQGLSGRRLLHRCPQCIHFMVGTPLRLATLLGLFALWYTPTLGTLYSASNYCS